MLSSVRTAFRLLSGGGRARASPGAGASGSGATAAFIPARRFGELPLHFLADRDGRRPVIRGEGRDRSPYSIRDAQKHIFVWGGSGSGKTYHVLNQIFEASYACTHLPPGGGREELKSAMLILEAKGDFREKTWWMARKYGREPDTIFFGPTHPAVRYNFFADAGELPLTRAGKMVQLMRAYQGGRQSADPFWESKASSLFANLFAMHATLERAAHRTADPEAARAFAVPRMSFRLLALLLMDRGQALNAPEVRAASEAIRMQAGVYRAATDRLVPLVIRLEADLASGERRVTGGTGSASLAAALAPLPLEGILPHPGPFPPSAVLAALLRELEALHAATDDEERARFSNLSAVTACALRELLPLRLAALEAAGLADLRERVITFLDAASAMLIARRKLIALSPVAARFGALRRMLGQYERLLVAHGVDPGGDEIFAYFEGEYLNVANEKMSGSVGAVASVVVSLFTMPPFDQIFTEDGTFRFSDVIDQGRIVYLDMPTAIYQSAATVAALALKMDFFQACLSRKRTFRRDGEGRSTGELINQVRPIFYHADEFASVASRGDHTGEAGFMDKCREFGVACVLGAQSYDVLAGRLEETDILSILSNAGTVVFLRNPNEKTNEIASRRSGQQYRAEANLTAGAADAFRHRGSPPGRGFSTSYRRAPRVEADAFSGFRDGEALLCLPPRFGRHAVQIVNFRPHPIRDPDDGRGDPGPGADAGNGSPPRLEPAIPAPDHV